jgi:hypothetical protein
MSRKPTNDKPMSATERSRAYRLRKLAEGATELHFTISGELAKQIDELVEFYALNSRAQVVSDLLRFPLSHARETMNEWKNSSDSGLNDSTTEKGKELVKSAKHLVWQSLTANLESSKEMWAHNKKND